MIRCFLLSCNCKHMLCSFVLMYTIQRMQTTDNAIDLPVSLVFIVLNVSFAHFELMRCLLVLMAKQ